MTPATGTPAVLRCSCRMAHYYFNVTDDEGSFPDDIGIDYATLEGAKAEAARALAEMREIGCQGRIAWCLSWRSATSANTRCLRCGLRLRSFVRRARR